MSQSDFELPGDVSGRMRGILSWSQMLSAPAALLHWSHCSLCKPHPRCSKPTFPPVSPAAASTPRYLQRGFRGIPAAPGFIASS